MVDQLHRITLVFINFLLLRIWGRNQLQHFKIYFPLWFHIHSPKSMIGNYHLRSTKTCIGMRIGTDRVKRPPPKPKAARRLGPGKLQTSLLLFLLHHLPCEHQIDAFARSAIMSLLGKKFPGALCKSPLMIAPWHCGGASGVWEMLMYPSTAKPMTPFFAAGTHIWILSLPWRYWIKFIVATTIWFHSRSSRPLMEPCSDKSPF